MNSQKNLNAGHDLLRASVLNDLRLLKGRMKQSICLRAVGENRKQYLKISMVLI